MAWRSSRRVESGLSGPPAATKTLTPQRCIELVESGGIKSQAVLAVDVEGAKAGEKVHYTMWTDSPNVEKAGTRIRVPGRLG